MKDRNSPAGSVVNTIRIEADLILLIQLVEQYFESVGSDIERDLCRIVGRFQFIRRKKKKILEIFRGSSSLVELLDDRVFAQDIVGQRGLILCHGRPVIPGESIVDGAIITK